MFWRQTVLPLAARVGSALAQWLAPAFGAGLTLAVDTDRIEALAADRAALGYGPIEGGARFAN